MSGATTVGSSGSRCDLVEEQDVDLDVLGSGLWAGYDRVTELVGRLSGKARERCRS